MRIICPTVSPNEAGRMSVCMIRTVTDVYDPRSIVKVGRINSLTFLGKSFVGRAGLQQIPSPPLKLEWNIYADSRRHVQWSSYLQALRDCLGKAGEHYHHANRMHGNAVSRRQRLLDDETGNHKCEALIEGSSKQRHLATAGVARDGDP